MDRTSMAFSLLEKMVVAIMADSDLTPEAIYEYLEQLPKIAVDLADTLGRELEGER